MSIILYLVILPGSWEHTTGKIYNTLVSDCRAGTQNHENRLLSKFDTFKIPPILEIAYGSEMNIVPVNDLYLFSPTSKFITLRNDQPELTS